MLLIGYEMFRLLIRSTQPKKPGKSKGLPLNVRENCCFGVGIAPCFYIDYMSIRYTICRLRRLLLNFVSSILHLIK